jgi:hypothetical protein
MHASELPRNRRLEFFPEVIMTMTKLDWLKLITINKDKKTRIEHYSLPLPNLPSIYILGEKQESSKLAKAEKLGTGESQVCWWATP